MAKKILKRPSYGGRKKSDQETFLTETERSSKRHLAFVILNHSPSSKAQPERKGDALRRRRLLKRLLFFRRQPQLAALAENCAGGAGFRRFRAFLWHRGIVRDLYGCRKRSQLCELADFIACQLNLSSKMTNHRYIKGGSLRGGKNVGWRIRDYGVAC